MTLSVADGSPTPLSDYLAKHCITIHACAKKLRLHEATVQQHARGLKAPSLGAAFLYQEQLGIDIRHWAQVPVVRKAIETRRDPDAVPKKQRDYQRRRYHSDSEFRTRVLSHGKKGQLRKIQMVKEGKAYYTTSAAGNPMIRIKPEFKTRRMGEP